MWRCRQNLWALIMLCIGIGLVMGAFIPFGRSFFCGLLIGGTGLYGLIKKY